MQQNAIELFCVLTPIHSCHYVTGDIYPPHTCRVVFRLQVYKVNTFLTHRWVVKVNGVEVQTWVISEREANQKYSISKSSLAAL